MTKMSLIKLIKHNRIKFIKSLVLFALFITVGASSSMPGPTLPDLKLGLEFFADRISLIIPARSGGYVIGSLAIGFLIKQLNIEKLLMVSTLLCALLFGIIPWNRTLIGLASFMFLNGIVTGIIDAAGNIWCLELWGTESTPFMLMLHLTYGVGALVGPLIAKPFLLVDEDGLSNLSANNASSISPPVSVYEPLIADKLQVQYAYAIISAYSVLIFFLFLGVFYYARDKERSLISYEPIQEEEEEGDDIEYNAFTKKVRIVITAISALFLQFYFALEIVVGSFLTTYAMNSELKLSKFTGATMSSVFWVCFTIFRFPYLIIIQGIGYEKSLMFSLFLSCSASVMLIFWSTNVWVFWVAICIIGFGVSAVFAAFLGYLGEQFPVTGLMVSIFVSLTTVGQFIWPLIVSNFIETFPDIFLIVIYCLTGFSVVSYAVVVGLCRFYAAK